MKEVILLLGSNMEKRNDYLRQALVLIRQQIGNIKKCSSVYETEAWGNTAQPPFLNQVAGLHTLLAPSALMKTILHIEETLGRTRRQKWAERTIDIDILFYGQEQIKTKELVIPHPFIHQRRFTLIPLAEIYPDFIHPLFNKTVAELLIECKDELSVQCIKRDKE